MRDPVRVEVVEDHFMFAEAIASVLREAGDFEIVGIAVTGPQAVAMAQQEQPDIVLLDFHLPGYTGDQLMERIGKVCPRARVVVLTSDTSESSLARAVPAGAMGYVTKDKALDDILQIVRTVAAGESALTDQQRSVSSRHTGGEGETLTAREIEIVRLLARGKDTGTIAQELSISANTVRTHVQNAFSKLGAHSALEAVALATERGLLR
jgi:DNA-binding NarL/FixJ family response regulator